MKKRLQVKSQSTVLSEGRGGRNSLMEWQKGRVEISCEQFEILTFLRCKFTTAEY